ncbi:UNKNOWN [Stylonychia lemnae]|uniref:Uncharacterized protein n=1 Tax=Stylonychia lemnae TaxID=5949 RepID=A0A078A4J3_STYLE|nr:UNKNOWN [Stylonychia lemnae]|eukprot:CDW77087.1 UNKNOWN [Stylonychia lemnae]
MKPIEAVIGVHQVEVIIEDNNANQRYSNSKFQITVNADISSFYESQLKGSILFDDFQKSKKFQKIGNIEARAKISRTGRITITFDQNLKILNNFLQKLQNSIDIIEWDMMVVNFKMYFLFYDVTEKLIMNEGYQIKFQIPPQISQSLENQIRNLGAATSVTLKSLLGSNFIINILMQFISFLSVIGHKVFRCFGE